jgi:hypothetical protein
LKVPWNDGRSFGVIDRLLVGEQKLYTIYRFRLPAVVHPTKKLGYDSIINSNKELKNNCLSSGFQIVLINARINVFQLFLRATNKKRVAFATL